jgi:hypothetical protein
MEGSFLPLFMGTDGSGPYTVEGAPANGPLPVQLVGGPGVLDVVITGPLPLPVAVPNPLPVILPDPPATYMVAANLNVTAGGSVLFQLQGSATKKIKILRLTHQSQATAATPSAVAFQKTTAAATAGVGAPLIAVRSEGADPAPTAVATGFTTAAVAAGAPLNFFAIQQITAAIGAAPVGAIADYEAPNLGKALTLNGVGEFATVIMQTIGAGQVTAINCIWTEQ